MDAIKPRWNKKKHFHLLISYLKRYQSCQFINSIPGYQNMTKYTISYHSIMDEDMQSNYDQQGTSVSTMQLIVCH